MDKSLAKQLAVQYAANFTTTVDDMLARAKEIEAYFIGGQDDIHYADKPTKITASVVAESLRELSKHVISTWRSVHNLVGSFDGKDNRLFGLGIKDNSLAIYDALLALAQEYDKKAEE